MQSDWLRQMVREVMAEELQQLRSDQKDREPPASAREEIISIRSDADLADFVRRLLNMTNNPKTRDDLASGRLQFKLGSPAQHQHSEIPPVTPSQVQPVTPSQVQPVALLQVPPVALPQGFVLEKHIDQLPAGTRHVTAGKKVRLTPLARDRLRAKNITIERTG